MSNEDLDACAEPEGIPQSLLQPGAQMLEELWPLGDGVKAVFLDYDGTIREFEARPELAVPTPEIQRLLAAMNARKDLAVHIISGRDAKFLTDHFSAHRRITLIAEHERRLAGRFQIWNPGDEQWSMTQAASQGEHYEDWKTILLPELSSFVERTPGSHLEEKASSFVWHHREVTDEAMGSNMAAALVERLKELVAGRRLEDVRIIVGHKIVEVSHHSATKGAVMRKICADRATRGAPFEAVLIAGDDVSDESMFKAAPQDSLTIKVGRAPTEARYCVDAPEQLRRFLWRVVLRSDPSDCKVEGA